VGNPASPVHGRSVGSCDEKTETGVSCVLGVAVLYKKIAI